jgi:hypothetical protein
MATTVVATVLLALGRVALSGCAPVGAGSFPEDEGRNLGLDEAAQWDAVEDVPESRAVDNLGLIAHTSLSNEVIVDVVRGFKYRGKGFVRVNNEPFRSTVSPSKSVALWVSEGGYDAFSEISPDERGSRAEVPVGTVIVREVLGNGKIDTITVMVKLPEGAFPLGGDFWYAATDAGGTIRTDESDGSPQAGLLANCGTCHLRRDEDAFLFGAPAP